MASVAVLILVPGIGSARAVQFTAPTPQPSELVLVQSSSVAEETVMKVLEDKFPNYTDPGYAACVLQNATENETQRIEDAGARDNFRAADPTVIEIIKREAVQTCIVQAGLPRIPF
jgi:hypothetical protein